MTRLLLTGLRGTLAPRVAEAAAAIGMDAIGWDRDRVPTEDEAASRVWLEEQRPDAIAHLAMGSPAWSALLAAHAASHGLPFVFTSTVMVFEAPGPHAPDSERNGSTAYGRYKIECEDAVRAANPQATVVRIGWQIDAERPGNNMLKTLDEWQAKEGKVAASRAWIPACSFMSDTAETLLPLLRRVTPGTFHLDSNAEEGHSFDRVVAALKTHFKRDDWQLETHDDYRHDQRLVGGTLNPPPLSARLRF